MKVFSALQDRINEIYKTGCCQLNDFNPLEDSKHFGDYTFDIQMNNQSKDLLKSAFNIIKNEDNPQIKAKMQRIENIAKGIMMLEKSKIATPEIIGEAIQYVI